LRTSEPSSAQQPAEIQRPPGVRMAEDEVAVRPGSESFGSAARARAKGDDQRSRVAEPRRPLATP